MRWKFTPPDWIKFKNAKIGSLRPHYVMLSDAIRIAVVGGDKILRAEHLDVFGTVWDTY